MKSTGCVLRLGVAILVSCCVTSVACKKGGGVEHPPVPSAVEDIAAGLAAPQRAQMPPAVPPPRSEAEIEGSCKAGVEKDCIDLAARLESRGEAGAAKAGALLESSCSRGGRRGCLLLARSLLRKTRSQDPLRPFVLLARACRLGEREACVESESSCRVRVRREVAKLGVSEDSILNEFGAPARVLKSRDAADDPNVLYNVVYERALQFGGQPINIGGWAVFNFNWYSFDKNRKVVSYFNSIGNAPENLSLVGKVFDWAAKVKFPVLAILQEDAGFPVLQAYLPCGSELLRLSVWCIEVQSVDRRTYQPTVRKPRGFGECRLRGFAVSDIESVKRSKKKFRPYVFAAKGKRR